jgi:hypothetical protein
MGRASLHPKQHSSRCHFLLFDGRGGGGGGLFLAGWKASLAVDSRSGSLLFAALVQYA